MQTVAVLGKLDSTRRPTTTVSASWNFNHSRKENETFDVATYGTSANGIEGDPARINVGNLNWFTTLSDRMLNEAHFTYSREKRPRTAVASNLAADTGMGFAPTFRFGNPFFLQPNVDELIWRTQIKDNVSIVRGTHTIKAGGEWMHTLNDQVFRGFFTGRYIFDSVTGFLRYASPAAAGGFGPQTVGCPNGVYVTAPSPCPGGGTPTNGPLLLYLQGAGLTGPATDAAGASKIANEEFSLFVQDQWQPVNGLTVNYGLRWDAQLMPETIDPRSTAYGAFLSDPAFPSDGTIPDQWSMFQPRGGVAWDITQHGKSLVRASAGVYSARQNMLSQVGSVTTNGVQQQTLFVSTELLNSFGATTPAWPGLLTVPAVPSGEFPLFSGVRVFHKDYENPRVYAFNVAYEQELMPDFAGYVDFTWNEGRNLTRFLNYNRSGPSCCDAGPGTGNTYVYSGSPWGPQLGEVMVANSLGESTYRGLTLGIRKRFSRRLPVRSELRARQRRGRRLERARSVHRSQLQLLRSRSRLGSGGSRHPAQGERLRLLHGAGRRAAQRPHPGPHGAADHGQPAQPQRRGPRPQRRAQGQRVLLVRLAPRAAVRTSAAAFRSCRSSRCSTPSTTPTTSTRSARRRCSTSTGSCARASAIRDRSSWR